MPVYFFEPGNGMLWRRLLRRTLQLRERKSAKQEIIRVALLRLVLKVQECDASKATLLFQSRAHKKHLPHLW